MSVSSSEAEAYVLTCRSDFIVVGLREGEGAGTYIRVLATLITATIVSSWCGGRKIRRLLLFFCHWLSGFVHQLAELFMAMLISICLTQSEMAGFMKALKFLELTGSNMLALTNLAICVNLGLIVSSHHTMSRVKSLGSPGLMLLFLVVSVLATAAVMPFWDDIVLSGTLLWMTNADHGRNDWISISAFFLELLVGVCMAAIVCLLLVFRLPELLECWKIHRRIRAYFGLTIIAIIVNLAVGIGGTVHVVSNRRWPVIVASSWILRHVHIALDTLVLYSALGVSTSAIGVSDENHQQTSDPEIISGSYSIGSGKVKEAGLRVRSSSNISCTVTENPPV